MRSWMVVTALGIAISVGGLVYYVFPKTTNSSVSDLMPTVIVQPEQRSGNPLLTATYAQVNQWFPTHCLAELYFNPSKDADMQDICMNGVRGRVESNTGVRLERNDILNASVKKHLQQVMGVN